MSDAGVKKFFVMRTITVREHGEDKETKEVYEVITAKDVNAAMKHLNYWYRGPGRQHQDYWLEDASGRICDTDDEDETE